MQRRWVRHGVPAGASTLLAVGVGALTNLATSHWSWALIAGLVVLTGCWVAWETRLRGLDQRAAVVEARAQVLAPLHRVNAGDGDVFSLLVAARRVMPLQGRRAELDDLLDWCDGEAAVALTVVSGPAGVGKTRLSLELGDALPQPWVAGWLAAGQGAGALSAIVACGDPVLVLVDDADTRTDLPVFLSTLAGHDGAPRVRVLLIARDGAGLQAGIRPLVPDVARSLTRGPVLEVRPHGGPGDRERWYAQAVGRFARDLKIVAPRASALAGRVGDDGETMLVVLARALLTVLAIPKGAPGTIRRVPVDEVIGELFTHEEAWWESAAALPAWAVSSLGTQTRQRCILALALRGASGEDAAVEVLRRVPDLSDASEGQLRNAARWVEHLYPAPDGAGVRIEPDLLGDWFVVDRLTRQPALAARLLADLDPDERQRVIAVLTRAAGIFPAVLPVLAGVWRAGGADAVVLAVGLVVVHHTAALDEHLAGFIDELDAPEPILIAVTQRLPRHKLPRTWVAVTRRIVAHRRVLAADDVAYQHGLAAALSNLTVHLADLGEHRLAHASGSEAVALWRTLASGDAAHEPRLAGALAYLSTCLAAFGDHRQAHAAASEAVALYRILSADDPAHLPDLASALNDLGVHLAALGQHREAHVATSEAVTLYRTLTADNPIDQLHLAIALTHLGNRLRALGEHRQAHTAVSEAVTLYRALTPNHPAFQAQFANALCNLGAHLRSLREHQQALAATGEAVTLWRTLAAENPAHLPDLATTLDNLGVHVSALGEHQQAFTAVSEAVALWRTLAVDNPAYRRNLATALDHLGAHLSVLGEDHQAHTATGEAVAIYRALAADNPAHQPNLAAALDNLGVHLSALGEHRQALIVTSESVGLFRALATDNLAHKVNLAISLGNLAVDLCELADHDAEFSHRREALDLYQDLAVIDANLYDPLFRQAVAELQAAYVRHGRDEEAVRLGLRPQPGVPGTPKS